MDRDDDVLSYVKGTMSDAERLSFETELQTDKYLAAEVDVMLAARSEFAHQAVPTSAALTGWDRLSASIDESAATPNAANDNRAPVRQTLQMAAAAVLAVGVWHFAISPSFVGSDAPTFRTASTAALATELNVVFRENASIGEISALLLSMKGSLVDGPSALGVFKLRFADQSLRDAAATAFSERSDLFQSVLKP